MLAQVSRSRCDARTMSSWPAAKFRVSGCRQEGRSLARFGAINGTRLYNIGFWKPQSDAMHGELALRMRLQIHGAGVAIQELQMAVEAR